jgi:hypothetical protein
VKVNGEFRYGGIFLDAISQMGINYPVIRVTITNGKATLALLPIHIPFVMVDPIDSDDNVRDAPIANETRSDIQQLDIFSDVLIKFARRDTATEFRGLIHDDDIKQILESAKILKNNLNIE